MSAWLISLALVALWFAWAAWVVAGPDVVSALVRRAKRTPYYHLTGYMNRWWLVPYRREVRRVVYDESFDIKDGWTGEVVGRSEGFKIVDTDGTGPVPFRKRPLAWLLQRFDISVRVHEILRSDMGRDPHDHPFNYLTIILRGYYWERRFDDRGRCLNVTLHGPGAILWRPSKSWHMLELYQGPVTTLFITGRKANGVWGFNVEGVKVPHREYRAQHPNLPWQ
jgi:hypothetical protein